MLKYEAAIVKEGSVVRLYTSPAQGWVYASSEEIMKYVRNSLVSMAIKLHMEIQVTIYLVNEGKYWVRTGTVGAGGEVQLSEAKIVEEIPEEWRQV